MEIYINGKWYEKDEAKVSVYDHGLLYGDGLFEGIRIYNGKIFRLKEHVERLFDGAGVIRLDLQKSPAEMEELLQEALKRSGRKEGYIRLLATRGKGSLGISPDSCPKSTLVIIPEDIQLYPQELYESGIPVVTAATRRLSARVFDPRIKSLNYLNNIMAKLEAKDAGCLEAVMLNEEGYVCECTADNIFIVKKGELLTPAPWLGMLEGITRNSIMELAAKEGIPCKETTLTRFDLYRADEFFITGSGAELMPITKMDGRIIGNGKPGPMTKKLTRAFRDLVNS